MAIRFQKLEVCDERLTIDPKHELHSSESVFLCHLQY
jgi:hypothetical protein